jgi:hypothetical protein
MKYAITIMEVLAWLSTLCAFFFILTLGMDFRAVPLVIQLWFLFSGWIALALMVVRSALS